MALNRQIRRRPCDTAKQHTPELSVWLQVSCYLQLGEPSGRAGLTARSCVCAPSPSICQGAASRLACRTPYMSVSCHHVSQVLPGPHGQKPNRRCCLHLIRLLPGCSSATFVVCTQTEVEERASLVTISHAVSPASCPFCPYLTADTALGRSLQGLANICSKPPTHADCLVSVLKLVSSAVSIRKFRTNSSASMQQPVKHAQGRYRSNRSA